MLVKNLLDDKQVKVRKYLDYPKFLSLIMNKTVFFAKPFLFEDKLDCKLPEYTKIKDECAPVLESMRKERIDLLFNKIINNIKNCPNKENLAYFISYWFTSATFYQKEKISQDDFSFINEISMNIAKYFIEKKDDKIKEELLKFDSNSKFLPVDIQKYYNQNTFITCWHSDFNESEAMWKLYSKNDGIAIETTAEKLEKYLDYSTFINNSFEVIINTVNYTDLNKEISYANGASTNELTGTPQGDSSYFFFLKRECYKHEHEMRICISKRLEYQGIPIMDPKLKNNGYNVGINVELHDFIDKIIISPFAASYYRETLISLLNGLNLKILAEKVELSKI